jgi:translation initiation factor RLI1
MYCVQHVYLLPKLAKQRNASSKVDDILNGANERLNKQTVVDALDLHKLLERDIADLSGGELQVCG